MSIKTPKGTRDFYPEDMVIQNHIFTLWKEVCLQYGFEEYESPMFEHLDLYTQKSGEEIVSQLYNFKDKGGRELALRPEMTPTLARMVNQKGSSLKLPIRWFSIPRLFRYERAQKGRLREFFQLNMDIIGTENSWAETDLITAIVQMLKNFGLSEKDIVVGISSRKLISSYLISKGLDDIDCGKVYSALDKWTKIPEDAFMEMLPEKIKANQDFLNLFLKTNSSDTLNSLSQIPETKDAVLELRELLERLDKLGYADYVQFDPSIIRGLAYYTGIVFEVFDKEKSLRAIAGGGRYDDLLQNLGGKPLTGVGFGIGDVVLYELLKEKGLLPKRKNNLDYFITSFTGPEGDLFGLASNLRKRGKNVAYSFDSSKLKKQLSQANEMGAANVLFFGSDKATPPEYEVKNLTTGDQSIIHLDNL